MAHPVRVAFIGAGAIHFGGGNTWDHASRLEKMEVEFVGIADPFVKQAERVLEARRNDLNPNRHKWANTAIFTSYQEMLTATKPTCVFIGVPPNAHGEPRRPIELDCIREGAHIFVEKPLSCEAPEKLQEFKQQLCHSEEEKAIISVAYMFRYSKAIQKMKQLVDSFGPIKLVQARYYCAYSKISKDSWWDVNSSGGPIVEQATHFIDAARFLAGEAVLDSVQAMSIKATEPAGQLSSVPIDESLVPEERRVPRVTTAMWRFESGAVGTLVHTALLHGWHYDTTLEVQGDGYSITLRDPYGANELTYRAPGSEKSEVLMAPDDPYWTEIDTFIQATQSGDRSKICSSYADAFRTYELSWAIRRAAEAS
jgi:predicted dehydrogenase